MALSDRIRELRSTAGKTLQQVADGVGASKAHISDLERGTATNPTFDLLKKLSAFLGVSVATLIDEESSPTKVIVLTSQVEIWIRQIRRAQAAGMNLDDAANEVRELFEQQIGQTLDATQEATWTQARNDIKQALQQEIEFLGNYSLRKPRRPEWYPGPKVSHTNWPPLQAYMQEFLNWDTSTIRSIDRTSTEITGLLENPVQSGFSGRGLVVGYVQSGKTANMTAVIAKAVDVGYRFVIILTGMTNVLRRQTQRRIDRDLCARNPYNWIRHTTVTTDFHSPPNIWFAVTDQVQLAVLKKNVSPLEQLLATIRATPAALRERMPVLIIDDECDQASVNASGSQYDITRINSLVRDILHELPRVQYVGYTATPFANVLINPETPSGIKDDLYPRDFITALPLPTGYFGAESLFGRDPIDADEETSEEAGLNMIREVPLADVAAVRPGSVKAKDTFAPGIPPSLDRALKYFVLATACRHARGQEKKHSSMLIHTTVYTAPHHKQAAAILKWRDSLLESLDNNSAQAELKQIWESEDLKVSAERFGNWSLTFPDIEGYLDGVLNDIEVAVENSDSETRLDFENGPKKYIVVGGSVLARGLTIEGLVVSYFVRTSNQYDTLLQMGRWFGYRPGYEELPRIWMTSDLTTAFRDLATVEAEIRGDIEQYRTRDVTPSDFAVRIRQIPGMAVTAAKKMISAESCDVSFSGEHLQTIRFKYESQTELNGNWEAGADLLRAAAEVSTAEPVSRGRLYREVPLDAVLTFLRKYQGSAQDLFSSRLLDYIMQESTRAGNPFHKWSVGVIEPSAGPISALDLGPLGPVKLVNRARLSMLGKPGVADIKALMSRQDVLMDSGKSGDGDWATLKEKRQSIVGDKIPLLLLYAINGDSKAKPNSQTRTDLGAAMDVLGVGVVFPERGERKSYVRVQLQHDQAEETEDLASELPPDGAEQ